jgi:hypothetical protein
MDKIGEMDMKIDYLLVVDQGGGVSWMERFAASDEEVARVAGGLISKAIRDEDIPAYTTEADIYILTNRVRLNLVWMPEPEKAAEEANPEYTDCCPGQYSPGPEQEAQNG